jgi:DNA (cytosine-5)-methyltransferase 1
MGRLRHDKPSVTIRTEFVKPEKGRHPHPKEPRPITRAEAARLQTCPLDHQWCGAEVSITGQIGNAVAVKLAAALATLIAETSAHHRTC